MFTTAGWWGEFWASSTPDLQSWAWMIGSFLTGSLAAALVTIGWNWWSAKQGAKAREKAVIASLAGELRRSKALCESNAKLRDHPAPPFIRFPTSVALRATFGERHHFPKLAGLSPYLVPKLRQLPVTPFNSSRQLCPCDCCTSLAAKGGELTTASTAAVKSPSRMLPKLRGSVP